ncbi:hypothetical protein HAX54_046324 [Datura stramonium]|uniref:Uncharacterized protein n=1 Tax=Datura stramonium TaxID=4076 RepID=A0ABS8RPP7_DATST|nr:hypothetical protein [Datura stramonium]
MAPKARKGKGVASSRHGFKRSRRAKEEQNEDASMPLQPLRKHVIHVTRERVCLVYCLMIGMPVNVGLIIKDVLRRARLRMNGVTAEKLEQLNMDYPLGEHSKDFCRVCLGFEDILDDEDTIDEEQVRVDSNLESDDEDDSEIGEIALAPIDKED